MKTIHGFQESDGKLRNEHMQHWFGLDLDYLSKHPGEEPVVCRCGAVLEFIGRENPTDIKSDVWVVWHLMRYDEYSNYG